jgi:hypothetical protein
MARTIKSQLLPAPFARVCADVIPTCIVSRHDFYAEAGMPDLTPDEIRTQLAAIGLTPLDQEDLDEITYRVNAVNEAVLALEHSDLDAQEPTTIFWQNQEELV